MGLQIVCNISFGVEGPPTAGLSLVQTSPVRRTMTRWTLIIRHHLMCNCLVVVVCLLGYRLHDKIRFYSPAHLAWGLQFVLQF